MEHHQIVANVRWPIQPLLDAVSHPPISVIAARIDVSTRTLWRWHHNRLTDTQADRAAIALGLHPANIWNNWHNPH